MSEMEGFENDADWDEVDQEDLDGVSFVCEDCDYRWEEMGNAEMDDTSVVCPMCGSTNVTQL